MNFASVIVLVLVAAAVFFAARGIKKQKGSCSCGCCSGSCEDCKNKNC